MYIADIDFNRKEADRILNKFIKDGGFMAVFLKKARELVKQS